MEAPEKVTVFVTTLIEATIRSIPAIFLYREPGNAQHAGKLSKKREKMTFPIVGPSFPSSQRLSGCGCGMWRRGALVWWLAWASYSGGTGVPEQ